MYSYCIALITNSILSRCQGVLTRNESNRIKVFPRYNSLAHSLIIQQIKRPVPSLPPRYLSDSPTTARDPPEQYSYKYMGESSLNSHLVLEAQDTYSYRSSRYAQLSFHA